MLVSIATTYTGIVWLTQHKQVIKAVPVFVAEFLEK